MKAAYDSIYISPHFDDAVLSCGGQIFEQTQQGAAVLIVTIAAGEPQTEVRSTFAQFLHHNWGFTASEGVAVRRAEDLLAVERLGADALHWTLPDCIYRLHPENGAPLYASNDAIFGPLHAAEEPLIDEIATFFRRLPAARCVVAPLAAGNHVDHQLSRLAAQAVWGAALWYYEDYPYVQRDRREVARLTQPAAQWYAQLLPLSPAALAARIAASGAYRSQISTLFNSHEAMESAITGYVSESGGERLWQRRDATGGAQEEE